MSRILIVLSVLVLVSCSQSVDIQLEPEVDVFLSHDREQQIRLTSQDDEYSALDAWLRDNRSGWHPTSGRYPGGVYVVSGEHGIQVTDTHVILYSTAHDEPKAMYIQKLGHGDLQGIRNIGERTHE